MSDTKYEATPPTLADHGELKYELIDSHGNRKVVIDSANQTAIPVALGGGSTQAAADATANPTSSTILSFLLGFNGTTWDRLRTAVSTATSTLTGILSTIALGKYDSTKPTLTNGQVYPVGLSTSAAQRIAHVDCSSAVLSLFSGTSPAASGTSAQTALTGLSNYTTITIVAALAGATGGTLDVYIQTSADGSAWVDYVHFTQLAASGAAVTYRVNPALSGSIVTVGTGTTPALAANTFTGGHWHDQMRVVFVAGSGTSAGATQTLTVHATRDTP